jgi:hypothetical protein
MNIDELKNVLDLISRLGDKSEPQAAPVEVGKAYLFRTVTHIEVGRVTKITGLFVTIEDASWIADTGRYHDCLKDGVFSEVEPYPISSTVNLSSLINLAPWPHDLPKEQK